MALVDIERVQLRNGIYHYRRRVPKDVSEELGLREWRESFGLRAGQERQVIKRRDQKDLETDQLIQAVRSGDYDSELGEAISPQQAQQYARSLVTAHGLTERDLKDKISDNESRYLMLEDVWNTAKARLLDQGYSEAELEEAHSLDIALPNHPEGITALLTEQMGTTDKKLVELLRDGKFKQESTPTLSKAYSDYLNQKEIHGKADKASKYAYESFLAFAGDTPVDEIRRASAQQWVNQCITVGSQSPATVRRRINSLKAIVNRCFRMNEIEKLNPFSGLELPKNRGYSDSRLPFHTSHLNCINKLFSGELQVAEDVRLVLKIMKYTGMANQEAAGMEKSDLYLEGGFPFVRLRPNETRASVKTEYRSRRVPIHHDLVDELRDYASRQSGEALFPKAAAKPDSFSARLNDAIRKSGVPRSKRLTAYSFRHTMKEAMRNARVPELTQRAILGHSSKEVADQYGPPERPLGELQEAVVNAIPLLGNVDQSIFTQAELPDNK